MCDVCDVWERRVLEESKPSKLQASRSKEHLLAALCLRLEVAVMLRPAHGWKVLLKHQMAVLAATVCELKLASCSSNNPDGESEKCKEKIKRNDFK